MQHRFRVTSVLAGLVLALSACASEPEPAAPPAAAPTAAPPPAAAIKAFQPPPPPERGDGKVLSAALLAAFPDRAGAERHWAVLAAKVPEIAGRKPVYESVTAESGDVISLRVVDDIQALGPLCGAVTAAGFECLIYQGGMPKSSPVPVPRAAKTAKPQQGDAPDAPPVPASVPAKKAVSAEPAPKPATVFAQLLSAPDSAAAQAYWHEVSALVPRLAGYAPVFQPAPSAGVVNVQVRGALEDVEALCADLRKAGKQCLVVVYEAAPR